MSEANSARAVEGSRRNRWILMLAAVIAAVSAVLAVVNGIDQQWAALTGNVAVLTSVALIVVPLRRPRR